MRQARAKKEISTRLPAASFPPQNRSAIVHPPLPVTNWSSAGRWYDKATSARRPTASFVPRGHATALRVPSWTEPLKCSRQRCGPVPSDREPSRGFPNAPAGTYEHFGQHPTHAGVGPNSRPLSPARPLTFSHRGAPPTTGTALEGRVQPLNHAARSHHHSHHPKKVP
jgi:hypothetical protein